MHMRYWTMSKRKGTPQSNNGQRNVRRINLNNCISDEPNVSVPVCQVQVTYEVFRPVTLVGGIEDHDLIISRKRPECPHLKRIEELETKCKAFEKQLNKRDFLSDFSEAYDFYGKTVILPKLKEIEENSRNQTIQGFKYWNNCTQKLSEWRDVYDMKHVKLQNQIDAIVSQNHIDKNAWTKMVELKTMRNNEIHPPQLTAHQYCEKLQVSITELERCEENPFEAISAGNQLIEALRSIPSKNNEHSTDKILAANYIKLWANACVVSCYFLFFLLTWKMLVSLLDI